MSCCFRSKRRQFELATKRNQQIKLELEEKPSQEAHKEPDKKQENNKDKHISIFGTNATLNSSPLNSNTPCVDFDYQWSAYLQNHDKRHINKQMNSKVLQKFLKTNDLTQFLLAYMQFTARLIQKKHFRVNLNIFKILDKQFDLNQKKGSSIIKIEQILAYKYVEEMQQQAGLHLLLGNIKGVLDSLYEIYGREYYQKLQASCHEYLRRLKGQINKIMNQSHKLSQRQIQKVKERFIRQFQQYMKFQLINQYLLNFQFILRTLKSKGAKKLYQYLDMFLDKIMQSHQKKRQIHYFVKEVENLYQFYIQHSEILEEQQQSHEYFDLNANIKNENEMNSYENDNKSYQCIFQHAKMNKDKQPPPKGSHPESSKASRKKTSNHKQSMQQRNKSQKNKQTQVENMKTQQKQVFRYIKYYDRVTVSNLTHCKVQHFLKYVQLDSYRPQQQQLLALRCQNEMNVVRYLSQIQNQFLLDFKKILDLNSKDQYMKSSYPIISEWKLVFEYECLKGDRDFSKINSQDKKQITIKDIWKCNSRKTVYSFLYDFANTIKVLEENHIHQADFDVQNFIKFKNKFYMIDLEHVYFVYSNNLTREYIQHNYQIFRCWLKSYYSEHISTLTSYGGFKQKKDKYYLTIDTIDQELSLNDSIQECINLMQQHMRVNHFRQFKKILLYLLNNHQNDIMSQEEIERIINQLKYKGKNHFYQNFLISLQEIYKKYSTSDMKQYEVVGQSRYLLTANLKDFQNKEYINFLKKKNLSLIDYFRLSYRQKYFSCPIIFSHEKFKEDYIISCTDDNEEATLKSITDRGRYVFNFIVGFLEILEQLEKRGFILFNIGINSFAKVGEVFKLKDFTYLFKLCMDRKEGSQHILSDEFNDVQLVECSSEILHQLIFEQDSGIRGKIFDYRLQRLIKLKNIFLEKRRKNGKSVQLQQLNKWIQQGIIKTQEDLQQLVIQYNKESYLHLLKTNARAIHVQQFKRVSEEIFSVYQPKDEQVLIMARQLIKNEQPRNFYQIRKILENRSSKVILSSYK